MGEDAPIFGGAARYPSPPPINVVSWSLAPSPSHQHTQRNDRYISIQPTWFVVSLHGPDCFKSQLPG